MVKILEKVVEEKSPEVRMCEDLFSLTKNILGEKREIYPTMRDLIFKVPLSWGIDMAKKDPTEKDKGIMVMSNVRKVLVYDAGYYAEALKLAEAYEKHTKEEWKLQKKYF